MSKKAFDKIAEGLTEALAIARGEKKPAKLDTSPKKDVHAVRGVKPPRSTRAQRR